MMVYSILKYVLFLACFGVSFYALSAVKFDTFCSVHQPRKVVVLMFLLSLVLGYWVSQAVLDLTLYTGLGGMYV